MADEAMNTLGQDTNASGEQQQETPDTETQAENTNPQESGADTDDSALNGTQENNSENSEDSTNGQEVKPFLNCKYNGKDLGLSAEEAKSWAQKGMHYSDKLDYICALRGISIDEFLKNSAKELDDQYRASLEEEFPDNPEMVDKLMKLRITENKEKYEKFIADREEAEKETKQTRNEEIGNEFISLQKRFPELKTISDVPSKVLNAAEHKSLEHAYLDYLFTEREKLEAAKRTEEAAKQQSAGSLNSEKVNEGDALMEALSEGIWGK